jgi:hypothetical protein
MMQKMKVPTERFGTSTGALTELVWGENNF